MTKTTVFSVNRRFLRPALRRLRKDWELFHNHSHHNLKTRYDRAVEASAKAAIDGDITLQRLLDLFYNGMGVKWNGVQQKIFHAIVDSMLPKIYGRDWENVKERVLHQRSLKKLKQEILIQMARRNGKTFSVAGVVAAFLLVVPNIKAAIFSVAVRQSQMLMKEIEKRIEAAWKQGTHVQKQDFHIVQRNTEKMIMMMISAGAEQEVGSFPGSVRVSHSHIFFFFSSGEESSGDVLKKKK